MHSLSFNQSNVNQSTFSAKSQPKGISEHFSRSKRKPSDASTASIFYNPIKVFVLHWCDLGLVSLLCSAVPRTEQYACVLHHLFSFMLLSWEAVSLFLFCQNKGLQLTRCYISISVFVSDKCHVFFLSSLLHLFGFWNQRNKNLLLLYNNFLFLRSGKDLHTSFGHHLRSLLLLTQHSGLQENINRVCKVLHAN